MSDNQLTDLPKANKLERLPHPNPLDKLRRALWQLVYNIFYRWTPVPAHGLRCWMLRLFGAQVASGARPYPRARIWAPWNLEMETNSCMANDVECYNVGTVVLKKDSIISQRASICTASHDFRDGKFTLLGGAITVNRGAWVAAESFLGPGVVVGESAVVGARSVVTRTIPSNTVVAGNPAQIVSKNSESKR